MSLITADDFDITPYQLPNLAQGGSDFQTFVDNEIETVLRKLLGGLLYDAYVDGIAVLPTPEQRWIDLRDGKIYQDNRIPARSYRWVGLKKMLIPYIYSIWVPEKSDGFDSTGVTVENTENSTSSSPAVRILRAQNVFSRIAGNPQSRSWCLEALHDTLYGFLYYSGSTYLDVIVAEYDSIITYLHLNYKQPGKMNDFDL